MGYITTTAPTQGSVESPLTLVSERIALTDETGLNLFQTVGLDLETDKFYRFIAKLLITGSNAKIDFNNGNAAIFYGFRMNGGSIEARTAAELMALNGSDCILDGVITANQSGNGMLTLTGACYNQGRFWQGQVVNGTNYNITSIGIRDSSESSSMTVKAGSFIRIYTQN